MPGSLLQTKLDLTNSTCLQSEGVLRRSQDIPVETVMENESLESGRKARVSHHRHVSPKDKSAAVLRLIRGDEVGVVAQETGVSVGRLERWQSAFLAGGLEALEKDSHHKTGSQKLSARLKVIMPWVGLLVALLITVLLLVRFLNRDVEQ